MPVMCYECAWRARDLREMPCVDACEERAGTAQAKPGDVVLCAHARARTLRCAGYRVCLPVIGGQWCPLVPCPFVCSGVVA